VPRRPRVFIEGGIYHAYNRFARGAEIFGEGDEAENFLELLKKVKKRDGFTVFAWCLMSNHYHIAMRAGSVPLARTLGYVQARFGQDYNIRWKSSGPRWQTRYKAKMIDDPGYLNQLIPYIHLNPVVARIVDDPIDYPYSGHREVMRKTVDPLTDVDAVLGMFGKTLRSSRGAYVRSLRGAGSAEWKGEAPGRLPWWERERDRVVELDRPDAWIDELGRSTGLERPRMSPQAYLSVACRLLEIDPMELASEGKSRDLSRNRYLIAVLGVERWGQQSKKIGELLGRRGDVVSRWVRGGSDLKESDEAFRAAFDDLDQAIASLKASGVK